MNVQPNVLLARGVLAAAVGSTGSIAGPANAATITLYSSTANCGVGWKLSAHFASLLLTIKASHDSDAAGVIVEGSADGATWFAAIDRAGGVFPKGYTAPAEATYDIPIVASHMRVRYKNSANDLTTFIALLYGCKERSKLL